MLVQCHWRLDSFIAAQRTYAHAFKQELNIMNQAHTFTPLHLPP